MGDSKHPSADLSTPSSGRWESDKDKGLLWRGIQPPLPGPGEIWSPNDWIELEHEHYIPVSKFRLQEEFWRFPKVQSERIAFKKFLLRLESLYHYHYHELLNELKNDYEFFDPDKGHTRRKGVDPQELLHREQRFLKNFLGAMIRGNFIPLQKEMIKKADLFSYLFDLKVKIQWQLHDPEMLRAFSVFYESDDPFAVELREILGCKTLEDFLRSDEDFQHRVWLFWRGLTRDQREVVQLSQKLDIMLSNFFRKLFFPFHRAIEILRGERKVDRSLISDVLKDVREFASTLSFGFLSSTSQRGEAVTPRSTQFEQRWLRRLNLENQPLRLRDLFKPKKLQEPSIEKTICLFRRSEETTLVEKLSHHLTGQKEKAPDPSIYLKIFKNVPLADLRLILPFKKPSIRSSDLSILLLTGLGSIYALYRAFQSGGAVALALLTVLGTLFLRMILGYFRTVQRYNARMISELYEKNLDNDVGVLQYLIDSIEEQEYKEAVLAYYMLWLQSEPMTIKELDGAIEVFMKEFYEGLEVDFEIEDAIEKILIRPSGDDHYHLPLVERFEKNGLWYYKALPLEEALEILEAKWETVTKV